MNSQWDHTQNNWAERPGCVRPVRPELRKRTLVVGLGGTGVSVVRFFASAGVEVAVTDSRMLPPGHNEVAEAFPDVAMFLGGFDPVVFERAEQLVVSPGVPVSEPMIQQAKARGIPVLGDVEVFALHADAPVIAITGSNGKSTVTTLVGNMAVRSGMDARMGGNLGEPALNLFADKPADCYVLELSSFQLETTQSLQCEVACVLNVSEDHLDRYDGFEQYADAKENIFRHVRKAVISNDDAHCRAMANRLGEQVEVIRFAEERSRKTEYYLSESNEQTWLMHGDNALMSTDEMRIPGRHNQVNALAAWAIGSAIGLDPVAMRDELRAFAGLRHRTQWLGEQDGVVWINDSKGTNVGATVAALKGLPGKQVLIAGGDCKGADFAPLKTALQAHARALVLMGRDAPFIEAAVDDVVPVEYVEGLEQAIDAAARWAQPGDYVLFSPACASFDMFENYAARGEAFIAAVQRRLS